MGGFFCCVSEVTGEFRWALFALGMAQNRRRIRKQSLIPLKKFCGHGLLLAVISPGNGSEPSKTSRMKIRYSHLSFSERRKIARWHEAISPASQIVDGPGWNGSQKMSRLSHRRPKSSVRA